MLNMETSVAGFVVTEVQVQVQVQASDAESQGSWKAAGGFSLQDADPVQGSSLSAAASWRSGSMASLSKFSGESVKLRVAMADSRLFAIRLACADAAAARHNPGGAQQHDAGASTHDPSRQHAAGGAGR